MVLLNSSLIRSLTTYQRKLSSRNVMKLRQFTSTITIASITLPDTLIPTIVYWFNLDGFVINPDKWSDEFYDYDYIGAPWEKVDHSYLDPWGKPHRVGNGGFSFRSKKLLDIPKRAHIQFDVNWGDFYKHFGYGNTAEDGNICVHNRHIYEQLGCKFAPVEVAAKFSHEKQLPETQGITPFGFHYHLPPGTTL